MASIIVPFDKCPKCGSEDGFLTKEQAHGPVRVMHNYDGSECDNGEMHDSLTYTGGKYAYCLNCGKRIFKVKWKD